MPPSTPRPPQIDAVHYTSETIAQARAFLAGRATEREHLPGVVVFYLDDGKHAWPGQWLVKMGGGIEVVGDEEFYEKYYPN